MNWVKNINKKVEKFFYPNIDDIRARYDAARPRMFVPVSLGEKDGFEFFKKVFEISFNDAGRMAVVLSRRTYHTGSTSFEIFEINKDMSLSKKGAYWTNKSWTVGNPRVFAFGIVAYKAGTGFARPIQILEIGTEYLPEITFEDWKIRMEPWHQ